MYKELYRMAIFARVAENRSFSATAKKLGLGKSVISQHVSALEQHLGVRLINRNARAFGLTQEGETFFQHCTQMLETAETALNVIGNSEESVRGLIRVTTPHNLGLCFVVDLVHRFRARYPETKVDLILDDAIVNLIEEQIDVAIRVGPLHDSRHQTVKLSSYELVVCAGRAFPQKLLPKRPEDLVDVPWIELPRQSIGHHLKLVKKNGMSKTVKTYPRVTTNSGLAAQTFIQLGDGIGILPDYAIRKELLSGEIIRVLPEWRLLSANISAVFPAGQVSRRLRLFLNFAKGEFKNAFAPE